VLIGPYITERGQIGTEGSSASVSAPTAAESKAPARRAAKREATTSPSAAAVDLSAPELHKRIKPLLTRGADMSIASSGFRNAEQFATVAHAAHNTEVPFAVLKHRVLTEGKTLATAIRESKPELNAALEVDAARAAARRDVAAIAG
jgi:hypothetical protein